MIMYSIVDVLFALLTLWISTACKKEHLTHEGKSEKHSEMPTSCSTSRSKSRRSSLTKSRHKGKKKCRKSRGQPKTPKARKSLEPLGATPREKIDLIRKGMKRDVDSMKYGTEMENGVNLIANLINMAYPTFDDIHSDWDDEKKSGITKLKPKEQPMNRKELLIALGAKHQETAYPTMDDIASDWESKEDETAKKEGNEKKDVGNKEEADFELELLELDRKGDRMKKGITKQKKVELR